jgi:hypothetical protein
MRCVALAALLALVVGVAMAPAASAADSGGGGAVGAGSGWWERGADPNYLAVWPGPNGTVTPPPGIDDVRNWLTEDHVNQVLEGDPSRYTRTDEREAFERLQGDYRKNLTGPDGRSLSTPELRTKLDQLREQGKSEYSLDGRKLQQSDYAGQIAWVRCGREPGARKVAVYRDLKGLPWFPSTELWRDADGNTVTVELEPVKAGDNAEKIAEQDLRVANELHHGNQKNVKFYTWHHLPEDSDGNSLRALVLVHMCAHQGAKHNGGASRMKVQIHRLNEAARTGSRSRAEIHAAASAVASGTVRRGVASVRKTMSHRSYTAGHRGASRIFAAHAHQVTRYTAAPASQPAAAAPATAGQQSDVAQQQAASLAQQQEQAQAAAAQAQAEQQVAAQAAAQQQAQAGAAQQAQQAQAQAAAQAQQQATAEAAAQQQAAAQAAQQQASEQQAAAQQAALQQTQAAALQQTQAAAQQQAQQQAAAQVQAQAQVDNQIAQAQAQLQAGGDPSAAEEPIPAPGNVIPFPGTSAATSASIANEAAAEATAEGDALAEEAAA